MGAAPGLLWGKYFQFNREESSVLLDPVSLESVYLSRREISDLSAATHGTSTHHALAALGFTPGGNPVDRRPALLARLTDLGISPIPVRVGGMRVCLTDRCNMTCTYCFVDTNSGKADMTKEELIAGLTYLFEENAGQKQVNIQWFGGEPTIRFDLMQFGDTLADALAERHGVHRVRRTVVTNGARLTDDMLNHFTAYGYGVGVSIDGIPSVNQQNRTLLGGQPADNRIRDNVRRLLETSNINVGCNLTPTPANVTRLAETVAWIIDDLGLKFIYTNTPIPTTGRWLIDGQQLAHGLYEARMTALAKGGMMFSVLDRAFQALDTRRPMLLDHMQGDRTLNAALLPGGRVSLCDINFEEPSFLFTLDELREDPSRMSAVAKQVAPVPACEVCPALAVCGGPSRNEQVLVDDAPDPQMCSFYQTTVEIAAWDSTGIQ
ncbi:MAG: radical SAM protein [Micromonosporaceae bacterium]